MVWHEIDKVLFFEIANLVESEKRESESHSWRNSKADFCKKKKFVMHNIDRILIFKELLVKFNDHNSP